MKIPRESVTHETKRALVVCLVVVAVVAATSVGVASAQRAQSTPQTVDSCTTIDAPGKYVLTQDITASVAGSEDACIEITASNVVFDGAGHTITGHGMGHGVEVRGTQRPVTNVTVMRLKASNWSIGIFYLDANNGTIARTITSNNTEGIAFGRASGNELVENTAYDNAIGVALGGESQNNTIRGMVAVENKWGIHFERESGNNAVVNSIARNNTRWDYYSERNEYRNTVTDLELSTATVSFSGRNVALRSVVSPPALPRGTKNLDRYTEISRTRGGPSSLSLTIPYESTDGVSLWRHDGQYWSKIRDTQVDASANTVSVANLTEFGILAVLGDAPRSDGGPVTVTTDRPVSVQRTLTPVPWTTPTVTPTSSDTATSTDTSAVADSRPSTATEPPEMVSNARGETTTATGMTDETAARADSMVMDRGGFGIDFVRLFFVLLGVVGLVALGLVAVRQRR